jgi:hypothetical protein
MNNALILIKRNLNIRGLETNMAKYGLQSAFVNVVRDAVAMIVIQIKVRT